MAKSNNGFLPKGYSVPKSGGEYMKFQKGENKFRILSSPIVGMECWTHPDKEGKTKPVRFRMDETVTGDFKDKPKHFWAMVVWNYDSESIEILEITQKTIQAPIKALIDNPKWGSPFDYDINVTKEGEGKDGTSYSVTPDPKEEVSKDIQEAYAECGINLEALFEGADPFEGKSMVDDMSIDDIDSPPF